MNDNVKTILIIYKDKSKFYKIVRDDAKIMNYLFGYQIINDKVDFQIVL